MMYLKKYLLLSAFIGCVAAQALAQTTTNADSFKLYRLFVEKSTAYKKAPLQLEIELENHTNFMTSETDTGKVAGRFVLQTGLSYIQFGEVEQLVTDSIALVISKKLKQMLLYADPATVSSTIKAFASFHTIDFNLPELAKRYTIAVDSALFPAKITLTARRNLPSTSLPIESLELQYKPVVSEPVSMKTVKRTMIPISKEDYQSLLEEKSPLQLLKLDDTRHFIVKEQTAIFTYKSIRHESNISSPVVVADRVKKKADGSYAGINDYADYTITLN